jgi:S-DNA-T family DNA segregation ATPase FtsK/SpoIIIE
VLREGAALGVYLVLTANRAGSIRMNMSSNIPNQVALYLNDDNEVGTLFGRDRVPQSEILGRGQLQLDAPTAIQFFLPCEGEDDAAVLDNLEKEIAAMAAGWTGVRPERIPMVPERLTVDGFQEIAPAEPSGNTLFLGLNRGSAEPEQFNLFWGESVGIFPENGKQAAEIHPFLMRNLAEASVGADLVVIDAYDVLHPFFESEASLLVGKSMLKTHSEAVKRAIATLVEMGTPTRQCIVINGLTDVIDKLMLPKGELIELLSVGSDASQVIVMDHMTKMSSNLGLAGSLKENVGQILFGGDLGSQRFVDNLSFAAKKQAYARNVLHSVRDGELAEIVLPTAAPSEGRR